MCSGDELDFSTDAFRCNDCGHSWVPTPVFSPGDGIAEEFGLPDAIEEVLTDEFLTTEELFDRIDPIVADRTRRHYEGRSYTEYSLTGNVLAQMYKDRRVAAEPRGREWAWKRI